MKHPNVKLIVSLILLAVCMAVYVPMLVTGNLESFMEKDKEQYSRKMEGVANTLDYVLELRNVATEQFSRNVRMNVQMMTVVLSNFLDENGAYQGQQVFDDGAVIEVNGNEVIYPEGYDLDRLTISPDQLASPLTLFHLPYTNELGEYTETACMLGKISDRYYYIDWTSEEEERAYIGSKTNVEETLEALGESYGGMLFVLEDFGDASSEGLSDMRIVYGPAEFAEYVYASELGITRESLRNAYSIIQIKDEDYIVYRKELEGNDSIALLIIKAENTVSIAVSLSFPIFCIVTIIMIASIIWHESIQRFVKERVLSEEQKKKYDPARIRRIAMLIAAGGLVLVVVSFLFIRSMTELYMTFTGNEEALSILVSELNETVRKREDAIREEKEWYLYYADRIAEIMGDYPILRSKENLAQINAILGSQYIMLFDEKGREIACSDDYVGLNFGTADTPEAYQDFLHLTHGVQSIVHDAGYDVNTGLNAQLMGVRMTLPDSDRFGFLILALKPNALLRTVNSDAARGVMESLTPPECISIAVEAETHEVLYSSELSFIGLKTDAVGISDGRIRGGIKDYLTIGTNRYYAVTQENDGKVYFYLESANALRDKKQGDVLIAGFGFLGMYTIITFYLFLGYRKKGFEYYAVIGKPVIHGTNIEVVTHDGRRKNSVAPSKRWEMSPKFWSEMLPERKAFAVLDILLCLLLILILRGVLSGGTVFDSTSVFTYIVRGEWTRGLNLFAVCSIVLLLMGIILSMLILKGITVLLCSVLGTKGETICRLVYNLLQYALVIAGLFYAFGYLGINTSALLASVGLVSLAISLGSKDLVADILAGITIVFEGEYQVGDMVEIGGFRGKVQEIGVRSTKLIGLGDNIKIIGNRDVKNVLNMTQLNSWYAVELVVPASQSLEKIETLLTEELPKIGSRIPEIISGPYYKGVLSIGRGSMTLSIIAECDEENLRTVQRRLNRALHKLFERENIPLS